jgi:ribosomal protein L10
MGKNTLMRKCISNYCAAKGDDTWMTLSNKLVGNVGIIFTKGDLLDVRKKIQQFVVPAPTRAGRSRRAGGSDWDGTVPNVLLPNAQHRDED